MTIKKSIIRDVENLINVFYYLNVFKRRDLISNYMEIKHQLVADFMELGINIK